MKTPPPGRPWKDRELKLLGTDSDAAVARLLHRTREAVSLRRQKLGIRAPLQPHWTAAEIQMLGTRPDREIARFTGRPLDGVASKRFALGIKPWQSSPAKSGPPIDPEKTRLRFGPYLPPRTRRGAFLFCERRGTVKVGGYSDGPIPWPVKWNTRSLILCGSLLRAVRQESELAVAKHWGVCNGTVTKWRAALQVEPINEGTRQIKSYATSEAMTPALRAHLAAAKLGKPRYLSPQGRARLLAVLHRPKSKRWFKSMAPHFQARKGIPVDPHDRPWTPEEDRLVGTKPDHEVAMLLGRSTSAVRAHRRLKGFRYVNPKLRPWRPAELAMLGKVPDAQIVSRTGHPLKGVQTRRQELGLLLHQHAPPWTPKEEKLLGKKPDTEVARLLGRGRADVRLRRIALGLPAAGLHPHYDYWTPQENKLLGTAPDSTVAKLVGRSRACVLAHRTHLGLPSWRAANRSRQPGSQTAP